MIVVDTTVLVYAVGGEHPLQQPCRELIRLTGAGDVSATTTVEVIQEFCHVRARRRNRSDAAALSRAYAELFTPLITVDGDDLVAGLELFEATIAEGESTSTIADGDRALGAFDAVLVAAAMRRGARALVSADKAFAAIEGPVYLDPSDPDFVDRLLPVS